VTGVDFIQRDQQQQHLQQTTVHQPEQ